MKRNYRDKATVKKRMYVALCGLCVLLFVLTLRLSYIMIFKAEKYSAMAVEQWTSEVKIAAKRGKILDRNGVELAVSANVYRVDFDLNSIRAYNKDKGTTNDELSVLIADAVGMNKEDVLKKLEYRLPSGALAGSATLIRRIEKEQADKIKALEITGVIVSPDTKRYYPNNNFLAHVLGNTNSDGVGLNGVELIYNKELSGVPGVRITEIDRSTNDFPYTISKFTAPVNGSDVVLTIDEQLQYFAEKVADIGQKENNADAASVIIMNPKTGEILAMANKGDFDPNNPYEGAENFPGTTASDKLQKMWRNRAVSDSFEPGSIFKIITSAAALEYGLVDNGDTYTCGGSLHVGDRAIHCWKHGGHGTQTFEQIVQNSCNVGFMLVGQKLGAEKLNEYIKKFGFGKKSGVDLPGESPGITKKTESISEMDLATISFGQTNTVNPIQFMTALNAVANGGTLIQPHVMKEVTHLDESGSRVVERSFESKTVEGIIKPETSARLREILESVATVGGSKNAYIEGQRIAGKTGTAQKIKEGGGYGGGYVASFVGFIPADDPIISVMVSVDNPSNGQYYGGQVAAPLAKVLFTDIINYLDLKPEGIAQTENVMIPEVRGLKVDEAKKQLREAGFEVTVEGEESFVSDINPKPGYNVRKGSKITLYTSNSSNYNKDVIVPDFSGYTKENAMETLSKIGLKGSFQGQGTVIKQSINPGDVVKSGSTIKFTLGDS